MATTKEEKAYIEERLQCLGDVLIRPMMGEYLLYHNNILFGGIYDGRTLIKIVPENKQYGLKEEIPYKGAKPMYMIEDLEDEEKVKEIVFTTCKALPIKKKK